MLATDPMKRDEYAEDLVNEGLPAALIEYPDGMALVLANRIVAAKHFHHTPDEHVNLVSRVIRVLKLRGYS